MDSKIIFKKLDKENYETLKEWWHSERVKQFWDNSEEMEQDVDNYVLRGEKTYYDYYIGLYDGVPYEKLSINKDGMVNIINLKNIPEMLGGLRKDEGILPAYHMNKEHWITILLDGTVQKKKYVI